MRKGVRNAIIAGAVTRISCQAVSLDDAIKATLAKHKATISYEAYDNLRRDVEGVLSGKWPQRSQQLEMSMGR